MSGIEGFMVASGCSLKHKMTYFFFTAASSMVTEHQHEGAA